jgi:hypothetical protein
LKQSQKVPDIDAAIAYLQWLHQRMDCYMAELSHKFEYLSSLQLTKFALFIIEEGIAHPR